MGMAGDSGNEKCIDLILAHSYTVLLSHGQLAKPHAVQLSFELQVKRCGNFEREREFNFKFGGNGKE